ncbi:MAG: molecular chaperone TorD family protein [Verrucomicrobia bacterium]|nr:molecular chaperone TorD family protein [Verrucomicrobiota bacterium]
MNTTIRNAEAYRFLSEVLLYPADRDVQNLELHAEKAGRAVPESRDAIQSMMANPELDDCDTYLESFEIGAKCPLYLGHYLFEEPKSCSGAAVSRRNGYMIQLKNLYRHFGYEVQGRELPDYLPLMLDFLALSASHPAYKHRRLLVKQFILPALPALSKALREASNVYAPIAAILGQLLHAELETLSAPPPTAEPVVGEPSPGAEFQPDGADAHPRSADLQSAVSPISNRQGAGQDGDARNAAPLAGWKPAIQQVGNLRHEPDLPPATAQGGDAYESQSRAQPSCL